jgi:GMP synthase (glutamine-hydrolysing)
VTPRLAVVQHEDGCPLGLLAGWWSHGVEVALHRPDRGEPLPAIAEVDGVVVLGGSMSCTDDAAHGWLAGTRGLLRDAVAEGVPTLGVCLGLQLLAVARGGRVAPNPGGKQLGVLPLGLTPAAADDPLFGTVAAGARALQWNDDVVVAPPRGAEVLAATPGGVPQALRVGAAAWGVQFHPEVDVAIVAGWAAEPGRPPHPGAPAALAQLRDAGPELVATWRPVADRFAALVAERRRAAA